jgi:hypothetical protein
MKFRLTIVAMALSVLAVGPVYAAGSGGCDYGGRFQSTSVEPQEQSEAAKKLAELSTPAGEQDSAGKVAASAPGQVDASTSQDAEKTTTQ